MDEEPRAVETDQMDAVTDGGNRQAVLSLHERRSAADTCTFGLTLTNRLEDKITNITFHFAAFSKGDVFHRQVMRNFFEIDPGGAQYREISFPNISCDEIESLEVTDPGRCTLGELERFSSQPGDCIRQVHIAETPYVKLVREDRGPAADFAFEDIPRDIILGPDSAVGGFPVNEDPTNEEHPPEFTDIESAPQSDAEPGKNLF